MFRRLNYLFIERFKRMSTKSSENWMLSFFEKARLVSNGLCSHPFDGCSTKAKYIILYSTINGAWTSLACKECKITAEKADKDFNHPYYDSDNVIAEIEPLDNKMNVIK